ncbi:MAG: PAS domain-containing protein, partial [Nitrospiraceae bacterium]
MTPKTAVPLSGIIVALIAGIFAVDMWLPLGLTVALLYVAPVLISSWISHQRVIPLVATLTSLLTVLEVFRPPLIGPGWVAICNRAFTVLAIWTTAILCIRRQHGEDELRSVYQRIETQIAERTVELEEANRKLKGLRKKAVSQLAALVQSSDDAIIGMTLNGMILNWNAGAERIYGYPSDEAQGRSISMLCPQDRQDEIPMFLDRIARGEHVRNVETMQHRKQGSRIDVSLTISPVKDAEGAVIGASFIARDITERKRIEAALRESEARFHMMADTAPVMVWMADQDGQCMFVNKRWLEFTGQQADQELGEGWMSDVHPHDRPRCFETYRSAFETHEPFTMEFRLKRADGDYRWVVDTGV